MTESFYTPPPQDYESSREYENEEISGKFQAGLAQRGHRSPFSTDYLNSRPRSALERFHITAEQEEQILYLYAATYSLHQTASSSGIALDKVRAVVYSPQANERIQSYRDEMKVSLLQKIEETQVVLLDAVQDPEKLKSASITQISEVFVEISETQGNLISSLQSGGSSIREMDPTQIFDGEDLEYIALLRRRLAIGSPTRTEDHASLDSPLDLIDTDFISGDSINLDPSDFPTHDNPGPEVDEEFTSQDNPGLEVDEDVFSHDNPPNDVDEDIDIIEFDKVETDEE